MCDSVLGGGIDVVCCSVPLSLIRHIHLSYRMCFSHNNPVPYFFFYPTLLCQKSGKTFHAANGGMYLVLVIRKPCKTQNGGKEALSVGLLITYSGGAANGEDLPGVAKTKDGRDFD